MDAVVPFMGESITDGTLATFLKSKYMLIKLHIYDLSLAGEKEKNLKTPFM